MEKVINDALLLLKTMNQKIWTQLFSDKIQSKTENSPYSHAIKLRRKFHSFDQKNKLISFSNKKNCLNRNTKKSVSLNVHCQFLSQVLCALKFLLQFGNNKNFSRYKRQGTNTTRKVTVAVVHGKKHKQTKKLISHHSADG